MVTVRIIHRSISLDSLCVLNARGHRSGEKVNQMPSDAVGVIVLNARGHRSGEKPRCSRSLEALARASLQAHGATLLQGHGARETD
jgi:hypothetical protein